MKKLSQNFSNLNKDLKIQRNDKMETKNVTVEMKKSLQGINSKSEDTEEWTSNQENRIVEVTNWKIKKKKELKRMKIA